MIVYIYDSKTKLFSGQTNAQEHPKKKDEFLLPSDSTNVPIPEDYSVNLWPSYVEENDSWELVESQYSKEMKEDIVKLELENLDKVNDHGVKLYDEVEEKPVLRSSMIVEIETQIIIKNNDLDEAKQLCENGIFQIAKEITKGSNLSSIQAFISAFQLRMQKPSEYSSAGLIVYYEIDGFPLYSALDTDVKIELYYSSVLVLMDLDREAKISTYIAQKNILEAELVILRIDLENQ